MKTAWAPRRRTWLLVERTSGAATRRPRFHGRAARRRRAAGQAATQAELQRAVVAEQQRALVQQVIAKLTEVSFDACLQKKPDSTLSAGERACIHTVVGKYLDTSEFVLGRSTKKAQQSQMLS